MGRKRENVWSSCKLKLNSNRWLQLVPAQCQNRRKNLQPMNQHYGPSNGLGYYGQIELTVSPNTQSSVTFICADFSPHADSFFYYIVLFPDWLFSKSLISEFLNHLFLFLHLDLFVVPHGCRIVRRAPGICPTIWRCYLVQYFRHPCSILVSGRYGWQCGRAGRSVGSYHLGSVEKIWNQSKLSMLVRWSMWWT